MTDHRRTPKAARRALTCLLLTLPLWGRALAAQPPLPLGQGGLPASFMAKSRSALPQQQETPSAPSAAPSARLDVAIAIDFSKGEYPFPSHQTLWMTLTRQLSLAGHNVTVLFASVEGVDGVEQAAAAAQRQFKGSPNVRVTTLEQHKLRYSAPAHVAVAYDVYRWLAACRPQIAYFTDWQGLGYYAVVAKRQGLALQNTMLVTLIAGPHIWHAVQPGGSALSTTADLEIAYMEAASTERSDVVITPNTDMTSWLADRGWKFPDSLFTSGFFPLTRFEQLPTPPRQTLSERLSEASEGVEFVYVGSLTMKSGLPLFCSAITGLLKGGGELPAFDLTILGPSEAPLFSPRVGDKEVYGDGFLQDQVKQWRTLRSPSPLRSMEIMDSLDTPQLLAYLVAPGKNRIAVLPSPAESGGFTMAELLLQGVPFIATNTTLARNLISPDSHFHTLVAPVGRVLSSALRNALVSPPKPARPADAVVMSASAWSSWHAALSKMKGAVDRHEGNGKGHEQRPEALFPPGVEVLASSFAAEKDKQDTAAEEAHMDLAAETPEGGWPMVSVVLVTYNRPELLVHALKSLRAQTYPEDRFEVVLVDDGSTSPEALALLAELEEQDRWFAQRGWRVVRSAGGYLGNARNKGFQAALGEWVMFMDDDNYAKPREIATFIHAATKSGAEVLTCFNDYLPDGAAAPTIETIPAGRYVPLGPSSTASTFRNAIGDANAMFKRTVLQDLGGWAEDDAYAVQDWEVLSAAILRGYKVEVVPDALYWYRTNSGSMVRNKLYSVTNSLPMRSFLRYGQPLLSPAIVVAAKQAEDAALLRQKVAHMEGSLSSQAQLLNLMSADYCKGRDTASPPANNRLRASEFERWTPEGLAEQWDKYDIAGYTWSEEARPGSFVLSESKDRHSVNVTLTNIGQSGGAIQHHMLGQAVARPLLLQGWARVARMVGGSGTPADFSIYADITYQDGTHRWAFHIPMDPDSPDWQHGWAIIDAPKPIHLVTVVTMFRWFEGTVLFDDLSLTDVNEGMCYLPV